MTFDLKHEQFGWVALKYMSTHVRKNKTVGEKKHVAKSYNLNELIAPLLQV